MTKRVRKAVIPAAGFGTRFLPATKAMPKEMLPVVNKPVIQYVVEELVAAGITDIILVTGYHKRAIEDHFDTPSRDLVENLRLGGESKAALLASISRVSELANFIYVRQKGPYGNGAPLLNVAHLIGDEPFIYTWSDEFFVANPGRFVQLVDTYQTNDCSVLGCVTATKDEEYDRYGFAGGTEVEPGLIEVTTLTEKPGRSAAPSDFITAPGLLLTPAVFEYLDRAKDALEEGRELYWNDPLKLMIADGHRLLAKKIENAQYFDTGNVGEYLKATVTLALEDPDLGPEFEEWLAEHLRLNS